MSVSVLFGLVAFILAVIAAVRGWGAPPWGMLLPVAVALLALIHVLGGTYLR